MVKKADKKQCWCSWCKDYEFYGLEGFQCNWSWSGVKQYGFWGQTKKEWNFISTSLKSGKLSYTRFVGETLVWLAIGLGIGCLIGKFIGWLFI